MGGVVGVGEGVVVGDCAGVGVGVGVDVVGVGVGVVGGVDVGVVVVVCVRLPVVLPVAYVLSSSSSFVIHVQRALRGSPGVNHARLLAMLLPLQFVAYVLLVWRLLLLPMLPSLLLVVVAVPFVLFVCNPR